MSRLAPRRPHTSRLVFLCLNLTFQIPTLRYSKSNTSHLTRLFPCTPILPPRLHTVDTAVICRQQSGKVHQSLTSQDVFIIRPRMFSTHEIDANPGLPFSVSSRRTLSWRRNWGNPICSRPGEAAYP